MAQEAGYQALLARVERMDKELQTLRDRQAILDCLTRYTHIVDRHDWARLGDVYWDDGIANHGDWVGRPADFPGWLGPRLETVYSAHCHSILNHLCEIEGDTAHAETYAVVFTLGADKSTYGMMVARYIDRLEKRDGAWKIALRRIVGEWRGMATGVPVAGFPPGAWNQSDLSCMRPLELTPELKAQLAEMDKKRSAA